MYYLTVALLMFALPVASILVEILVFKSLAAPVLVAGKWFVFWAVGARLFLAGLRQVLQPRFTAETILGIKGDAPLHIVQELGFANISIGALGLLSILRGAWVMPAAIAGCLFYGLAGIRHLTQRNRNALENTATVSDLFMFAVLAAYAVIALA